MALWCLPLSATSIHGTIVGVSDGDTVTLLDNAKTQHKIRLAQIDAPEKSQEFGQVSKQHLSDLCFGKSVIADIETIDKYGRSVAVITCENIEANLEQVKSGNAWVYKQYAKESKYFSAETLAKSEKLGLWGQPNPTPPWEYRKNAKLHTKDKLGTVKNANSEPKNKQECGSKSKCTQMSSCAEARFYFETCRVGKLDRDNDGMPCEKLCK